MTETATPNLKVIDLGCKLGNSLAEFIRRGSMYYGELVRAIQPGECLGIDMQARYQRDLVERGFNFLAVDITAEGALEQLPEADYYLAWDFLEHLPTKEWASAVIQTMLHKARKGVWIRMPSFEQDESTGEGALKKLGLRFTWTNCHGHKCPLLVEDVVRTLNDYKSQTGRNSIALKLRPGKRVRATDDPCVVPVDSPMDTTEYRANLGPKPVKDLETHLVSQWEVVITI